MIFDAPAVERVANGLIADHFKHLGPVRVLYAFTDSKPGKPGTCKYWGAARVLDPVARYLSADAGVNRTSTDASAQDLAVVINSSAWAAYSADQKAAAVYHLLSHFWREDSEKSGEGRWIIKPHDIEAFGDELKLYGPWNATLEAQRRALGQIGLPFEDAPRHASTFDVTACIACGQDHAALVMEGSPSGWRYSCPVAGRDVHDWLPPVEKLDAEQEQSFIDGAELEVIEMAEAQNGAEADELEATATVKARLQSFKRPAEVDAAS